ncbi:carboxypeptidase regulatory-like domain-containing protein [Mariniphaga sediminis]|uniref:Carboxypeptidase regulatory-like domain-containing protein n=1 Tax=Mariniphaga sediminis TaxID=1628158 RepID=A0A399D3Z3_9BACT|nr:carboxypeptidase-like regulatory domain-containing protein [Mariniphaga sediminis]RIH66655.1 carboxypeptidase regulatory-like domain-containing protein [Mariniphaga sediminis]
MFRNLITIIVVCFVLSVQFSSAQITVDQNQLSNALKEEIEGKITDELTSSVQSAEAWVTKETYFSIILEPLEPFGISPSDPNFINQANDIYQKIQQKVKDDPSLTRSGLLKEEMKGLVKQGLINYASSYVDKESFEIYDQCSNLFSAGKEKIEALLDAAEGISGLAPDDADYESDVTAILKKYGIKSDYFYLIDDLDQVLSVGYEKLADPLSAFSTVASAMSSDDPVYKIEMLFELGESFGGKVPIIGDLITPIFTLGKGVLSAAKGLENVLEKNLNQGCINSSGGTYASVNKNKRTLFIKQFPNAGRVCPLNQDVYNPVYNNTYQSTSYATDLYFYLKNKWEQGKKDKLHVGREDIFSTIRWLRSNGHAEKATDLEFIVKSFQKEYGWKTYTDEVQKRIDRIQQLFQYSYATVNICEKQKAEQFYMDKIGFNWLVRLLTSNELEYSWNELKILNIATHDILNSMIKNYYLSKHHNNLNQLDKIIRNLEENVPVNIYGTVNNGNGVPVSGAKLQVGLNSMFSSGDTDHKITTSTSGYFSYYLLMVLDNNTNMTVSATTPGGNTVSADIRVEPGLKDNTYRVELNLPYEEPDTTSSVSQNDTSNVPPQDTVPVPPPPDPDTTSVDINTLLSQADCANVPGAVAQWDAINEVVVCSCPDDYYRWDETQKKCVPDIQAILNNSNCSQYPNTQPVWDYSLNEPICECKPGYVWNKENTACVEGHALQVANSDCSGYFNSQPVWDDQLEQVICECLPGYVWNKEGTGCIPDWEDALANSDCSSYPNTEPVWDPVGKEVYCDCIAGYQWADDNLHCERVATEQLQNENCSLYPNAEAIFDPATNQYYCECLPGYKWNSSRTGCVQERKKPDIDWNSILSATINIINAANGNNPLGGTSSGGSMTGTQAQQPVVHQSNCNDKQEAGGNAPEVHHINLGQSFGTFTFDYETYDIKDQILVSQGGQIIFNTGCVGADGSVPLKLNGRSSTITVKVNPNCDGTNGTSWNFTVHCPTH